MSEIKLVSLDIDGTLYPHKSKSVNPYHTVELCKRFKKLKDMGMYLSLCTGKTAYYVERVIEEYDLFFKENYDVGHVVENGVLIMSYTKWPMDLNNLSTRFCNLELEQIRNDLENKILIDLPGTLAEGGKTTTISIANRDVDMIEMYNRVVNIVKENYYVCEFDEQDMLVKDSQKVINAIVEGSSDEELQKIVQDMSKDFYITYTPTAIDIVPYPFGKSLAMTYLAKQKNVELGEIIALGDSPGDHSVFQAIGENKGIPLALKPREVTKEFVEQYGGHQLKRPAPLGVVDALDCLIESKGDKVIFKELIKDVVELQ